MNLQSASIPPELANHPQYEVTRELGRGGMGVVYLARNRLMDRLEVLKVVNKALFTHPEAAERFLREIRSAAKLNHPNVVTAYNALQEGELLVLSMEYVPGEDLGRIVKTRGPLPVATACYYVYQAALGLQHAHERQMVHRDIKPANLILHKEGRKRIVKVLDFGLAKATSEKSAQTDLTAEGRVLGTPDYIAPEQTMDAASADIRADVYSLGCTLYYLLTGRGPYLARNLYELLRCHQESPPDPIESLRADVPPELIAVILRMLAKSPLHRYQTPGEVSQALIPFFKPGNVTTTGTLAAPPVYQAEAVVEQAEEHDTAPVNRQVTLLGGNNPIPNHTAHINPENFYEERKPRGTPSRKKAGYRNRKKENGWVIRSALLGSIAITLLVAALIGLRLADPTPATPKIAANTTPDASDKQMTAAGPTGGTYGTPLPNTTNPGIGKGSSRPTFGLPGEGNSFTPLFNGRNLDGWRTDPGQDFGWSVLDGKLVGRARGYTHLFSLQDDFADVHLRARLRVLSGGNGGVGIRAGPSFTGRGIPTGYWCQIDADGPAATARTGSLFVERWTGSEIPLKVTSAPPSNTWFDLEMLARGKTMEIRVNGQSMGTYTDDRGGNDRGRVALQIYAPMQSPVESVIEFQTIEVSRLSNP